MASADDRPQSLLRRVSATVRKAATWTSHELGLSTLNRAPRDTHLLLLSRFTRMFAYGSSTLILALYFSALGHSDARIGLFMTLTLLGDVVLSLALTAVADRVGRRVVLGVGGGLMAGSGVVFAVTGSWWWLLGAAVVGVISPSGNEIGPFRAIEESTLSHLLPAHQRTEIFAWYIVAGTLATGFGSLCAGWGVQYLVVAKDFDRVQAYRAVWWGYACLGLVKAGLAGGLSRGCEVGGQEGGGAVAAAMADEDTDEEQRPLLDDTRSSPERSREEEDERRRKKKMKEARKGGWFGEMSRHTWIILAKLLPLFAVDSFASGLVPFSLITYYIDGKFHPDKGVLGTIMSVAWFFSAFSNIFASPIARRIGLVKTMVFTHLPSAIFLALFPLPSSLPPTITLLILRATLASMDQAPRSAFLAQIILPHERTAVMGVVNVAKTLAQSGGPVVTGWAAGRGGWGWVFVGAGALKGGYDLGLLGMFLGSRLEREGREEDGREEGEVGESGRNGSGNGNENGNGRRREA